MSWSVALADFAPAKVNLTLRVVGRRADGYHELESLVVFADFGDRLSFVPGGELALTVRGPSAAQAGDGADNLVLKAARALAVRCPGLGVGAFRLDKRLPVAAGLGGGSSDAAAALRLLAQANGIARDDARLYEAARSTGADVPVCLDPRPRIMRGIGEVLSAPLALPRAAGRAGQSRRRRADQGGVRAMAAPVAAAVPPAIDAVATLASRDALLEFLDTQSNDLERPAIAIAPVIGDVLAALRALPGCRLARMSGSGATCFGLFSSAIAARAAAKTLRGKYQHWWVRAGTLGSGA